MKIENRLKLLASENPNYAPLLAQWEFDKRLLSRALNSISNSFPHYSLHDISHSSTIINQIEKIIAPNIVHLSATDCWLLLEACYWHDSGMIVNHDEKRELVKDKDFINYLSTLKNDGGDFSIDAASILDGIEKDDIEKLLGDSQSLMFIIADYYRSKHAVRSEEHVNNPTKIGVDSPRTYLIPQRLISILGKICSCHGKEPESILELQKATDGMDLGDYAHPRYIAGLLRIGDLLDIDDGRFCETLLKSISKLPRTSCAHKRKHESIKNLYIDSRVIEIKAECEDYESFTIQQSWFDYIQSEFDFQKRVWNDIVPNQEYVSLPTVNNISCEIKGYITVNGKVPRVNLDKERIYQYLTGSLLYNNESPFLREIIQNSIDAIHYKLWAKYFYDNTIAYYIKSDDEAENRRLFIDKLKGERIKISIRKSDGIKKEYILSIQDTGMGMALEDIEKITSVGSKNKGVKNNIIASMPDWAKPSGFFGIGFQSVFDVSNKVVIETKQNGELGYQIEFNKLDNRLPDVGIKNINKKWFEGTRVDIYLSEDELDKIYLGSAHSRKRFRFVDEGDYPIDPLVKHGFNELEQFESHLERIFYQIKETFLNLEIGIDFNNKHLSENRIGYTNSDFEIGLDFDLEVSNDRGKTLGVLYRGSVVDPDYTRDFLKGNFNIFLDSADQWLSINRDGIRSDKHKNLRDLLKSCIVKNKDVIYANSTDKNIASLYLKTVADLDSHLWRDIIVNGVSLGQVFDGASSVKFSLYRDIDEDENYTEEEGSVINPIDVLEVFYNLVIKLGRFPIYDFLDNEDIHLKKIIELRVVQSLDTVEQIVAPELALESIQQYSFASSRRGAVLCYLTKYFEVGLARDEIPDGVMTYDFHSAFDYGHAPWARYIFLPTAKKDLKFEEEVDLVCGFLSRIGKKVDRKRALELFGECWTYLNVMPEV